MGYCGFAMASFFYLSLLSEWIAKAQASQLLCSKIHCANSIQSGAEKADLLSIFTPSSSKKLDKEEEKKVCSVSRFTVV